MKKFWFDALISTAELLADEAVDGEVDGRVERKQRVARVICVAQRRDVKTQCAWRRKLSRR